MEKKSALDALAGLAHETRLEVFRLLVRAGAAGLTPGALATELGVPPATLSFHLKELKNAGIVRMRREGRSLHYSACFDTVRDLLGFLTENCCQGAGSRPSAGAERAGHAA